MDISAKIPLKTASIVVMALAVLDLTLVSVVLFVPGILTTAPWLIFIAGDLSPITGWPVGTLIIFIVIGTALDVAYFIVGLRGLKRCGDPAQSGFFIIAGFVIGVLSLSGMFITFTFEDAALLAAAILYVAGGFMHKKARKRR